MKIEYEGTFDAGHRIQCFAERHKCRRLHGHTWKYLVTIKSTMDGPLVLDFGKIGKMFDEFDHKVIVSFTDSVLLKKLPQEWIVMLPVDDITSERLAQWCADAIMNMLGVGEVEVIIWESDHACATASASTTDPNGGLAHEV